MNLLVAALGEVLAAERRAATNADVEQLLALQEDKRRALEALRAARLPATEMKGLAETARQNLALLRHLVGCLRAMAGVEPATYGPNGALRGHG